MKSMTFISSQMTQGTFVAYIFRKQDMFIKF